jgi:hypothetical protein
MINGIEFFMNPTTLLFQMALNYCAIHGITINADSVSQAFLLMLQK